MKKTAKEFTREMVDGEWYEFVPLGKNVVACPEICGGRPTFKYTRLEVSVILDLLAAGHSIKEVLRKYAHSDISAEAIKEAVQLAKNALLGKIIQVRHNHIDYYVVGSKQVFILNWPAL